MEQSIRFQLTQSAVRVHSAIADTCPVCPRLREHRLQSGTAPVPVNPQLKLLQTSWSGVSLVDFWKYYLHPPQSSSNCSTVFTTRGQQRIFFLCYNDLCVYFYSLCLFPLVVLKLLKLSLTTTPESLHVFLYIKQLLLCRRIKVKLKAKLRLKVQVKLEVKVTRTSWRSVQAAGENGGSIHRCRTRSVFDCRRSFSTTRPPTFCSNTSVTYSFLSHASLRRCWFTDFRVSGTLVVSRSEW